MSDSDCDSWEACTFDNDKEDAPFSCGKTDCVLGGILLVNGEARTSQSIVRADWKGKSFEIAIVVVVKGVFERAAARYLQRPEIETTDLGLSAHGLLSNAQKREIRHTPLNEVVLPVFEVLFDNVRMAA